MTFKSEWQLIKKNFEKLPGLLLRIAMLAGVVHRRKIGLALLDQEIELADYDLYFGIDVALPGNSAIKKW